MKGSRPLSDAEVRAVLESLGQTRTPARDRALFILGVRSGFRISELLSLTLKDVRVGTKIIARVSVARRNMKGKGEGRSVPLHPEAAGVLDALARELEATGHSAPDTFLFRSREGANRAISRSTAWRLLGSAYRKCGLMGKLGTHAMRKTFAKRVHEKGGKDLLKTQKLLGHKNVNSTVSYLSVDENELDDVILKS